MARKTYASQGASVIGPYSQAVESGGLVYLSGQTPIDPATGALVPGGIAEQTTQVLKNLSAVLDAAGLSLDHAIKTTVFLTDMSNFAAMNLVYESFFASPYPARSTIGVQELPKGALVEIELIASRDAS
jgi:2-iminobutanoate/2-iminopropanoate deaminase